MRHPQRSRSHFLSDVIMVTFIILILSNGWKLKLNPVFVPTTEMALAVIPQCPLQITLMSVNPSLRDKKPVQEVLNKYKTRGVQIPSSRSLRRPIFRCVLLATVSFVMSVRLSVRISSLRNELGVHWTDFHEIWYVIIFRKSAEKIRFSFKSDINNGHFTWRPIYIFDHIKLNYSYNETQFRQRCREFQNTL
jgi:hypothetical protein